jgi:FMN-dependent NADH-azoreductase
MTKLLFVQASPRGKDSGSLQIAEAYLDVLLTNNPDLDIDTIDLWNTDLPAFDGNKVAAKIKVITGQDQTATQKTAWDQIVAIADRFTSADRYVFAVPMWNGGIPYRLKHYIDLIHQPGLTFGLNQETGYFGLLKNKHATLALTSGAYAQHFPSPAFGVDHHSTYLRSWLNQAGVTAIDEIRFQPTLLTKDLAGDLQRTKQRAAELAHRHGRV